MGCRLSNLAIYKTDFVLGREGSKKSSLPRIKIVSTEHIGYQSLTGMIRWMNEHRIVRFNER